jgi:hypothetical protein
MSYKIIAWVNFLNPKGERAGTLGIKITDFRAKNDFEALTKAKEIISLNSFSLLGVERMKIVKIFLQKGGKLLEIDRQ